VGRGAPPRRRPGAGRRLAGEPRLALPRRKSRQSSRAGRSRMQTRDAEPCSGPSHIAYRFHGCAGYNHAVADRLRRAYIDWARGLAVLLMIEAHAIDAWTRTSDKQT